MGEDRRYSHLPATVPVPFLSNKFDRLFRTPRGLMEFGGHTVNAFGQFPQNMSFGSHPVCVVVSCFPVVAGCMAVLPISVSVVHAGFNTTVSTGEMQLANQPTVVASGPREDGLQEADCQESIRYRFR